MLHTGNPERFPIERLVILAENPAVRSLKETPH